MTTTTQLATTIPPGQIRDAGEDVFAFYFANFSHGPEISAVMEQRRQIGLAHYGQPLMTDDGRHTLTEIVGEEADALIYLTKLLMQHRNNVDAFIDINLLIMDVSYLLHRTIQLGKRLGEVTP